VHTVSKRRIRDVAALLGVLSLAASACSGDSSPAPLFPADYADTYRQVRDCRHSIEHDVSSIRVLADLAAFEPYMNRDADFPEGAVVLKEEYAWEDVTCSGPLLRWTVSARLAAGSAPEALDWAWQKLNTSRKVVSADEPRCILCHTKCGVPPDGYEGTCAVAP
jgi:hypothetical protein